MAYKNCYHITCSPKYRKKIQLYKYNKKFGLYWINKI